MQQSRDFVPAFPFLRKKMSRGAAVPPCLRMLNSAGLVGDNEQNFDGNRFALLTRGPELPGLQSL